MALLIVSEKPAHTGTLDDIRNWMRAESTRDAWIKADPNFGAAFVRYMAGQEPDDVRRVFSIEPVAQLKEDPSVRGRGHFLFAIKHFEDAAWTAFIAALSRD